MLRENVTYSEWTSKLHGQYKKMKKVWGILRLPKSYLSKILESENAS